MLIYNTELLINCFRSPQTPASRKTEKHNLSKKLTVDCSLKPIPRSGAKHSVGKVIPYTNLEGQDVRSFVHSWVVLHPWYFKLQWMSCGHNSGMSGPGRSRSKLTEHPVIQVRIILVQHYADDTTTINSDQDKAWPPNTPGAREAEPPHRKTILKDWEYKCIIATK